MCLCVSVCDGHNYREMLPTCSVGGGCLGESPGVSRETDKLSERLFM